MTALESDLASLTSGDSDVKWLKNAFAIDSSTAVETNESQRALIERLCAEVVRRRLTTPALLMLETNRPFNYVSAQLLHFFEPLVSIVAHTDGYRDFARFLEQRGSIDYLTRRIQALEAAKGGKQPDRGDRSES